MTRPFFHVSTNPYGGACTKRNDDPSQLGTHLNQMKQRQLVTHVMRFDVIHLHKVVPDIYSLRIDTVLRSYRRNPHPSETRMGGVVE